MTELNNFNIDLAKRIELYLKEMLKAEKQPQRLRDKQREEKVGGKRSGEFVKPTGNVPRIDEDIFTVNVTKAELEGGKKKKINRLKKAEKWRDFSGDTLGIGLDLGDKAWTIKDNHDPKMQAMKSAQNIFGGKKKKVNRLKKAERWRDFSADTLGIGLDLGDKAWTIKDNHDPASKAQNSISKAFGGGRKKPSKARIDAAINKLQAFASGVSRLKPTKLQMQVLEDVGVIEPSTQGGSIPKKPNPKYLGAHAVSSPNPKYLGAHAVGGAARDHVIDDGIYAFLFNELGHLGLIDLHRTAPGADDRHVGAMGRVGAVVGATGDLELELVHEFRHVQEVDVVVG